MVRLWTARLFGLSLGVIALAASARAASGLVDQSDAGATDPRRAWLDQVEASRRRSQTFIETGRLAMSAYAEPARVLTVRRRRPQGHLDDPTLRAGDAVMTQAGLRIFRGEPAALHRESDFAPLDEVAPRGHWLELTAIGAAR